MKRIAVLFLVLVLLTFSLNLYPKERHGTELVVQKLDGQQLKGELVVVKQTSLVLLGSESGADISAKIEDIKVITIVKKSKKGLGIGLGFLAGAGVGAFVGGIILDPVFEDTDEWIPALIFAGVFAIPSALVGWYLGSSAGKDETIQIEGRSDTQIKAVLRKLRRQARITNAQ